MVAAVVIAVGVMLFASGPISRFVHQHPTVKMLALSFLLLIGVTLLADGFGFHVEKGYIYAAMGFAVFVEALNYWARRRRQGKAVELHPTFVKDEPADPAAEGDARRPRRPGVVGHDQALVGLRVRTEVAVVVGAAGLDQAERPRPPRRSRIACLGVERAVVALEAVEALVDELAQQRRCASGASGKCASEARPPAARIARIASTGPRPVARDVAGHARSPGSARTRPPRSSRGRRRRAPGRPWAGRARRRAPGRASASWASTAMPDLAQPLHGRSEPRPARRPLRSERGLERLVVGIDARYPGRAARPPGAGARGRA